MGDSTTMVLFLIRTVNIDDFLFRSSASHPLFCGKDQLDVQYRFFNSLHGLVLGRNNKREHPGKSTCRRCLRDYNEPWSSTTPIDELGQIMLKNVNNYYTDDLCPDCTEQLGMFTLLWFK